jgi:hypothetical protein
MPVELMLAPFESMRRPRTHSPGAGLGLSIAKGIVAAHGGRIELEQAPKGTCFRVYLPVEKPAGAAPAAAAAPGASGSVAAGPVVNGTTARTAITGPGIARPGQAR